MEGKLKCKKCGRVLKSPTSIACGIGQKCAGVSPKSGKSVQARIKQSSGVVYENVGSSPMPTPTFFSGDLPTKRMSKRELYRRRREERRRSFETREPFQCGMLLPKRKPVVYTPLGDGSWKENPTGRVISHERLQEYLRQYHLI
jgi:hypothetical protein